MPTSEIRYKVGGDNAVLASAVYDAHKGRCWWCTKPIHFREAELDHMLPKTAAAERIVKLASDLGLEDFDVHDPRNLGPICPSCNREKSSTDFSESPRILSRLRHAERLRGKVIRIAETFADSGALASALLRAKEADLSDEQTAEVLREHGPGLIQALANLDGFVIDYTEVTSLEVSRGMDESSDVLVSLDAAGRRALAILEAVCGADLADVLEEPLVQLEIQIHAYVTNAFEGMEAPGGSTYAGPPVNSFFDVSLTSLSVESRDTFLEFFLVGSFETLLFAGLMQDKDSPGTLEEVQGEAFVTGSYSFTAQVHFSQANELEVGEAHIEYLQEDVWTQ